MKRDTAASVSVEYTYIIIDLLDGGRLLKRLTTPIKMVNMNLLVEGLLS